MEFSVSLIFSLVTTLFNHIVITAHVVVHCDGWENKLHNKTVRGIILTEYFSNSIFFLQYTHYLLHNNILGNFRVPGGKETFLPNPVTVKTENIYERSSSHYISRRSKHCYFCCYIIRRYSPISPHFEYQVVALAHMYDNHLQRADFLFIFIFFNRLSLFPPLLHPEQSAAVRQTSCIAKKLRERRDTGFSFTWHCRLAILIAYASAFGFGYKKSNCNWPTIQAET